MPVDRESLKYQLSCWNDKKNAINSCLSICCWFFWLSVSFVTVQQTHCLFYCLYLQCYRQVTHQINLEMICSLFESGEVNIIPYNRIKCYNGKGFHLSMVFWWRANARDTKTAVHFCISYQGLSNFKQHWMAAIITVMSWGKFNLKLFLF